MRARHPSCLIVCCSQAAVSSPPFLVLGWVVSYVFGEGDEALFTVRLELRRDLTGHQHCKFGDSAFVFCSPFVVTLLM